MKQNSTSGLKPGTPADSSSCAFRTALTLPQSAHIISRHPLARLVAKVPETEKGSPAKKTPEPRCCRLACYEHSQIVSDPSSPTLRRPNQLPAAPVYSVLSPRLTYGYRVQLRVRRIPWPNSAVSDRMLSPDTLTPAR